MTNRRSATPAVTLLFVLLALTPRSVRAHSSRSGSGSSSAGLDEEERRVLARINEYRVRLRLHPLLPSPLLSAVASAHSADMAARGYFAHRDPEGRGPFDRMRAAGYRGGSMGENLAAGNGDAARTFRQWYDSPAHDEAMRDPEYRVIGLGRVHAPGTRYEFYWTAVFGNEVDPSTRVELDRSVAQSASISAPGAAAPTPRAVAARPAARRRSTRLRRRTRTVVRMEVFLPPSFRAAPSARR